ncbi:Hybrid sensor histidine kinase/response regulator [Beijerinckiaceae bacterium RH AL1]|nr:Hybrid sensor histidine kinase/response regulator [Beijerinckiaceae bacterium RH CH11]VVB48390.1 Hybrid sensor histidine kinase/response regulator [Beijerinckiaceae bacterium RH AL8]VVC56329.1 Hybrid sensor histidine kinase/response regulator [Beijerinckiaceae bacterium RH AL1]
MPSDTSENSPPRGERGRQVVTPRADRVPRSTIALLAISVLLPLALFSMAALQNRRDVERAALRRVERDVRILHEQALKVFDTQELMIDQLNGSLKKVDWSDPKVPAQLHNALAHLQALLPQVAAISVTDAAGHLRATSRAATPDAAIDLSDRDYFVKLKAQDTPRPMIARGVIGRQSHEPVFNIAARLQGPVPGRFEGVIVVSIEQSCFTAFYRDAERDAGHMFLLADEDGNVLVSEPKMTSVKLPTATKFRLALEGPRSGPFVRPAVIDGARRIVAYERVGGYPVIVGYGIPWKAALMPWWRNMWGYGIVALLSSLVLLAVSGFAIRRIALEAAATVRWRRAASRLEAEMAERAKVEEQLRQSQKMEAVGRLTGGIAHDFNNLLTVVIGSLDLLTRRMKDADPRQQTLVANAVDGAQRAATLTARLLAFSRQHPLDPEVLDANATIRGMSSLLQRTLVETVAIDLKLAEGLWSAFVDPNQLENAILNLAVNAVDAMPRGGTLTIETANATLDAAYCANHADLTPGEYVMVAVGDTGTGMSADVLAHAFEPFFTTKPVGKGTGLGLSQVYGFARQSRGHAAIRSVEGEGTVIKLFMPRRTAEEAAEAAPVVAASEIVPAARNTKILIVEDDDLVRAFSTSALRDAGYTVVEAATGPDGLNGLRLNPDVALLFTDIILKGPLNGCELADQVAVLRSDLPVLFTTGYTKEKLLQEGDPERGIAVGDVRLADGNTFLAKPFTAAALTAKVAALLATEVAEVRHSAAG